MLQTNQIPALHDHFCTILPHRHDVLELPRLVEIRLGRAVKAEEGEVDQVIHTLGIFGNRERYALYLVVEGVKRGAGPTISNLLMLTFFRRSE
jgi:hypothetical protein